MALRLVLVVILAAVLASEAARHRRNPVAAAAAGSITPPQRMHFFMHDMVDLGNSSDGSTVLVAGPRNVVSTMAPFGSVMVIDDPLTRGPSLQSKLLGRAKGTYMSDSSSPSASFGIFLTFTAVLKNGTLSFHGQDDVLQDVREIAIVGGTGAFRFATGYAQIRTHKFIPPLSVILSVEVFFK